MFSNCPHPRTVIDVLADGGDEVEINILVNDLSVDVPISVLTELLTNTLDVATIDGVDILDGDLILPVAPTDSALAASLPYSADVLAGTTTLAFTAVSALLE